MRTLGNVIWVIASGMWLAPGDLFWALILAITIIDIPFAVANVKLAGAAPVPFGKTVMSVADAQRQSYRIVVGIEPLG